jgi:[ribosomal protein S5]-alanine N-acetyltransferase
MPHAIETERLLIRPFTLDDIDAAYAIFEGHADVWKFDPGYQRTHEQRAALIHKYAEGNEQDGCGTLAITLKDTGALLGYVGLQLYVLPREPLATPEVELYYKLGRAYWGQGYATEACRALIRFAFDEMRLARIVTIAAAENMPSIKLLEALGMEIAPAPPSWAGSVTGTLQNDRL